MKAPALHIDARLALHPREPADAPEMLALVDAHRADLRTWLPWVDTTRTLPEVRRYAQFSQAQMHARIAFDYAIRCDGELVGAIGLHAIDWANRSTQMGYWLGPPARGRGIATRAAAALVEHASTELDVNRLEIHCVTENTASRAVAERLGFRFEGTLAQAYFLQGTFRDIALYARLRPS